MDSGLWWKVVVVDGVWLCCIGAVAGQERYLTVPIDCSFKREVKGESKVERWSRFGHNIVAVVAQCVQASSRETYETGWRRWVRFSDWFGTDPYLRESPTDWPAMLGQLPVKFKDFVVVSFMQQLSMEDRLCPGTVGVYMSAVRYYFKVANLDVRFLESDWISSARTAINLLYRRDNPIAGKKGLPFTCDMVVFAETKAFNTNSDRDHAILTAIKLATTCLLRVSEYLPNPGKLEVDHWMRAEDVMFILVDRRFVPAWRVHLCSWEDVRSVVVTVRGGKNDPEGEGQRYQFQSIEKSSTRAFDIVWDLFSWAVRAQPLMGQPFLSFRGQWVLSYHVLSQAIKRVAREMGVDARRYRTHSLRIGGASMLAAAGVPDYVIQKQGRWKSLAFLEYIRLARSSFELALAAIVNPCLLTVYDVGRMHAGVEWQEGVAEL